MDVKALAKQGWDAYYARDLEGCLATYTDDAEVILPGAPPLKGKDAIRMGWQMYMTAFPDEHPLSIRYLADGNTVIVEWESEATHTGPLMGPTGEMIPATGKTIHTKGVTVHELEGDKLARQVFYFDNAELMQQLGLMPAPAAAAG